MRPYAIIPVGKAGLFGTCSGYYHPVMVA